MIARGFFITGTDTEIGKTTIMASLLHLFNQQGLRAIGLKPVASGGTDPEILQQYASVSYPTDWINPFYFQEPIAPHLAAAHVNQFLSVKNILSAYEKISAEAVDIALVEGAGGWLTPLNDQETLADLAVALNYPVILVVGMRLGCINHALLTAESIQAKGLILKGWIANCIDPDMLFLEENIDGLQKRIAAHLLGIVPHQSHVDIANIAKIIRL